MSSLYEFECKLYHQHLGHRADAEDIHGDADLHGRTCNQQNHPALVAVITRQSLINRVRPIVYEISRHLETIVIITDNSGKDESTFTSDSRALHVARFEISIFAFRGTFETAATPRFACRARYLSETRRDATRTSESFSIFFLPSSPLRINRATSAFARERVALVTGAYPVWARGKAWTDKSRRARTLHGTKSTGLVVGLPS